MQSIALIDYGSGNLHSAAKALEKVAGGRKVMVTSEPQAILDAGHIVLPGVGAFADCAKGLKARAQLIPALEQAILQQGKPFMGICVGMQLLADIGHEHGSTRGLGWIGGEVVRLPQQENLKIPHMGWNDLKIQTATHPVLEGLRGFVYFVHSYHLQARQPQQVLATTDYGGPIAAIVGRDNILGTQFHPEKSQQVGLQFLERFLRWQP